MAISCFVFLALTLPQCWGGSAGQARRPGRTPGSAPPPCTFSLAPPRALSVIYVCKLLLTHRSYSSCLPAGPGMGQSYGAGGLRNGGDGGRSAEVASQALGLGLALPLRGPDFPAGLRFHLQKERVGWPGSSLGPVTSGEAQRSVAQLSLLPDPTVRGQRLPSPAGPWGRGTASFLGLLSPWSSVTSSVMKTKVCRGTGRVGSPWAAEMQQVPRGRAPWGGGPADRVVGSWRLDRERPRSLSVKSLALPEGKQSSQETNANIKVKGRPSSAREWARAFQQGAVLTQFTYRKTGLINRNDDTTIQGSMPPP